MSANSSFSTASFFDHRLSSTNTSLPLYKDCYISAPSSFIYRAYDLTSIFLILPLCIFILQHGLQEWWKKRSTSTGVTLSHSDSFTYNMVIMDLLYVVASIFRYCGISMNNLNMLHFALILLFFTWFGQTFFHMLTCVERYLAVVHPITYLSLRKERGIRIRNISISCIWLLCFALIGCIIIEDMVAMIIINFSLLMSSLIISSFCSLSVLCVLIHPGPGEQGRKRERVDQSKLRAFYTIVTILGMLVLRFVWDLNWTVVYMYEGNDGCVLLSCGIWFSLPSNLMLPLLFLHRKGKFVCCKNNTKLG